jgi:predicted O-methyltransferase YrrM
MEIVHPEVTKYINSLLPDRHPKLQEMEALARERDFPIIGPQVGRLLYQYTKIVGAKRIFELGSGFGYSAFWFALALPEDGKMICTEASQNNVDMGEDYLKAAGLDKKVDFRKGDAIKILSQTDGAFDIILNDIDKHDYPRAFEMAIPKLRVGGLLITDNTLWSGKVADEKPDAATRAILEYNRLAFSHPQLWTTLLPARDGLAVSMKIG